LIDPFVKRIKMTSLPPLSCNVCGQIVITKEAFMTNCSHLLCVKHGQSLDSCPVCQNQKSCRVSPLDFGHQLTSREISLLRSIAIKAPQEISQLLVECNNFNMNQAKFEYSRLCEQRETEILNLNNLLASSQMNTNTLERQLTEVTDEAEKSREVLCELRADLKRVTQQQHQQSIRHSSNFEHVNLLNGGTNSQALVVQSNRSKLLAEQRAQENMLRQQQLMQQQRNDREQQRRLVLEQRKEKERDLLHQQHLMQQRRNNENERQYHQQQQQLIQNQKQMQQRQQQRTIPTPTTGVNRSQYFSKNPVSSSSSSSGFSTPSRNSSFGLRNATPSRFVSSRKSSSFVRSRGMNTPNGYSGPLRRSNTPKLDFKRSAAAANLL